jgi:hypothetical protein
VAYFILISRNANNLHVLRTPTKTSFRIANILIYVRISKSREHDGGMLTATSQRPGEGYSQLLNRLRCRPEESGLISRKGVREIHFAIGSGAHTDSWLRENISWRQNIRSTELRTLLHSDEFRIAWSCTPNPTSSQRVAYLITYINMCTHPHLFLHICYMML